MPRDHYISKFLIKRWLPTGGNRVRVYDVNANRFDWVSPRTLFALDGLNSPEVERRIDQLIETPLAGALNTLLAAVDPQKPVNVSAWPVYRAAWLFAFMQGPRTASALNLRDDSDDTLEGWILRSDEELDQVCLALNASHNLIRFRTREPRLFLPSTGHFATPVWDDGCLTKLSVAQAVPFDPRTALLIASKDARLVADEQFNHHKLMPLLSVGSGPHITRLVVPPAIAAAYPDRGSEAGLAKTIVEMRTGAMETLDGFQEIRRLHLDAFARIGLVTERLPTGPERYRVIR